MSENETLELFSYKPAISNIRFKKENGWQAKDIYSSETKGYILSESNYPIYVSDEKLESRQYWPIFSTNIGASNGVLWNNYGY